MYEVENLLQEVSKKFQEFNTRAKYTGEKFNVFEVLGVETKEKIICRFLCEILSPSGSHCYGIFFLKSFIKNVLGLDISDDELKSADVVREYKISSKRKIDIVIRTKRHFIPIEVKIYAKDQNSQCRDYYEEAKNYYVNEKDAKIFYLTPDGHKPSKESSCGVNAECISFEKDVYEWISFCISAIVINAPIREILLKFASTIKKFTGQTEDNLKMEIAELITSSPENLRAAVNVQSAMKEALKNLQTKFFETVENAMKEKGHETVKIKVSYNSNQEWPGLFYCKGEYDTTKKGVLLDIEGGIVFIGYFIPATNKWPDEDWIQYAPNFAEPNEALFALCNEDTMKTFAEDRAKKIEYYLDKLDNA